MQRRPCNQHCAAGRAGARCPQRMRRSDALCKPIWRARGPSSARASAFHVASAVRRASARERARARKLEAENACSDVRCASAARSARTKAVTHRASATCTTGRHPGGMQQRNKGCNSAPAQRMTPTADDAAARRPEKPYMTGTLRDFCLKSWTRQSCAAASHCVGGSRTRRCRAAPRAAAARSGPRWLHPWSSAAPAAIASACSLLHTRPARSRRLH